jgi:hypothetical protein
MPAFELWIKTALALRLTDHSLRLFKMKPRADAHARQAPFIGHLRPAEES